MVPWIGRLMLGNPDNYRMLGVYTRAFGDCRAAATQFREAGLVVAERAFFHGRATAFAGRRPVTASPA